MAKKSMLVLLWMGIFSTIQIGCGDRSENPSKSQDNGLAAFPAEKIVEAGSQPHPDLLDLRQTLNGVATDTVSFAPVPASLPSYSKIYWSVRTSDPHLRQGRHRAYEASLGGSGARKILAESEWANPMEFAVDREEGRIYFYDPNLRRGSLIACDLDGGNAVVLKEGTTVRRLTWDEEAGQMIFIAPAYGQEGNYIFRASSSNRTSAALAKAHRSTDFYHRVGRELYYSNNIERFVYRVNVDDKRNVMVKDLSEGEVGDRTGVPRDWQLTSFAVDSNEETYFFHGYRSRAPGHPVLFRTRPHPDDGGIYNGNFSLEVVAEISPEFLPADFVHLDEANGKIYWVRCCQNKQSIHRMDLDDGIVETIVQTDGAINHFILADQ